MDEQEAISLYTQVKELAKGFKYTYEIGIVTELQIALEEKEVKEFHISWNQEGYYLVSVSLKEFNHINASKVFKSLARFLEYGDATLYAREQENDVIRYLFASLAKSGIRFFCQIEFS